MPRVGLFYEADEKVLKVLSNGMMLSFLLLKTITHVKSGEQIGRRLVYGLEGAQEETGGRLV